VNYVAKGANLYQLGYELHGSIHVITNYTRTSFLWDQVRVQGGAYGVYCPFDHRSGVLSLLSYRDPNLLATLDVFDQTGRYLRQLDLNREELKKAIIGAIGEMDAYQLPDAKGYTSMLRYLAGESDEDRQLRREQIFDTTPADFHSLGQVLERVKETGLVVVMGSQEAIEAANRARGNWLEVRKVL
jgi:Zn-dependent M16 (insulinase) family peptidase